MRFDPQAGFTPTDDAGAEAGPARVDASHRSAARWFLALLMAAVLGAGVWKFALPALAGRGLHARAAHGAESGAAAHGAMSGRLTDALDMMTHGMVAEGAGERRGAAFDAPVHVDEEALLAMIDATAAGQTQAAIRDADAQDAHVALDMAEQLMARGKFGDAQSLLRKVLDYSPNDAQVHYKLGLACVMQRDYAGARESLRALRTLDPSLASLLSNLVPQS